MLSQILIYDEYLFSHYTKLKSIIKNSQKCKHTNTEGVAITKL